MSKLSEILEQMEIPQVQNRKAGFSNSSYKIPLQLTNLVPLNSQDSSQQFYRSFLHDPQFQSTVLQLGFKVYTLEPEEEDLTLYCCRLLQGKALFPTKFFVLPDGIIGRRSLNTPKRLWMEGQILISSMTNSIAQKKFECAVYQFFTEHLVPCLSIFIKNRISWKSQVQNETPDDLIIDLFEKEVINLSNKKYEVVMGQN